MKITVLYNGVRTIVQELRQAINKQLYVAPSAQRLFFSGKEMQDVDEYTGKECTLYDYDVGKNGLATIMLTVRATKPAATKIESAATTAPRPPIRSTPAAEKKEETPTPEDLSITNATEAEVKGRERMHLFCRFNNMDEAMHVTDRIPWCAECRYLRCWKVPESLKDKPVVTIVFDITPLLPLRENSVSYYGLVKVREAATSEEARWQVVKIMTSQHERTEKRVVLEIDQPLAPGTVFALAELDKETAAQACGICGVQDDDLEHTVLCDQCEAPFHMKCLHWDTIPEGEWFCFNCEESHRVNNAPVMSKQKERAPAAKQAKKWGGGLACAGRSTVCNIVPQHHFGAIPGISPGTVFASRLQLSESGVHRPPVGGISGSEKVGSQSVVLAGGYEDDHDDGDVFSYTGAGGRDLSGNRRTNVQSADQKLDRVNKALASNFYGHLRKCANCPYEGPLCEECKKDWKKGRPVRVCRSEKFGKRGKMNHNGSKYAPSGWGATAVRYDGLYKVQEYWKEKGSSGFFVWRYRLARDDPEPAPWHKDGKEQKYLSAADLFDERGELKEEALDAATKKPSQVVLEASERKQKGLKPAKAASSSERKRRSKKRKEESDDDEDSGDDNSSDRDDVEVEKKQRKEKAGEADHRPMEVSEAKKAADNNENKECPSKKEANTPEKKTGEPGKKKRRRPTKAEKKEEEEEEEEEAKRAKEEALRAQDVVVIIDDDDMLPVEAVKKEEPKPAATEKEKSSKKNAQDDTETVGPAEEVDAPAVISTASSSSLQPSSAIATPPTPLALSHSKSTVPILPPLGDNDSADAAPARPQRESQQRAKHRVRQVLDDGGESDEEGSLARDPFRGRRFNAAKKRDPTEEEVPLPKGATPAEDLAIMTELVAADEENEARWNALLLLLKRTNTGVFLNKVLEEFKCPVCHELCAAPLTAPCKHSQCIACFRKSRHSGVNSCPKCRLAFSELTMDEFKVNEKLRRILRRLFPHLAKN